MDKGFALIWRIFFVADAKLHFGVSRAQQEQSCKAGQTCMPALDVSSMLPACRYRRLRLKCWIVADRCGSFWLRMSSKTRLLLWQRKALMWVGNNRPHITC